jgi:hypothetical protein
MNFFFFFLFETESIVLKRAFEDVYGPTSPIANYIGLEYTKRKEVISTNVYVLDCVFSYCISERYGGAIYCNANVYKLLIEQTIFFSCGITGNFGGAVFFFSNNGECVLIRVCGFNCSINSNDESYGQAVYAYTNEGTTYKNHVNDSSFTHSLYGINRSNGTLTLIKGCILCQSDNVTNNRCYAFSGLFLKRASLNCISYSSIVNNTSTGTFGCFCLLSENSIIFCIDTCNILNNEQNTSDYGTFYVDKDLFIKDSCVLGNNEGRTVFFAVPPCTITISNCTIDDDIFTNTRFSGTVTVNKTIDVAFSNSLSHFTTLKCEPHFYLSETPTSLSTETENPSPAPIPTWDGEWAEHPEVIIKNDDIPVIRVTHYPLQTEYVKTSVPTVITTTNISIGAVAIIIIIVISLYNLIYSAKKLTTAAPIEYNSMDVNSEGYVGLSSITEYSI